MNTLEFIIQILLLIFTGVIGMLLFLMVRQIGVVRQRIPKKLETALPEGTLIPVSEFASYDGTSRCSIPFQGSGVSFLLFAAFTCPTCQTLLDEVAELPEEFAERTALLVLDSDLKRFPHHLRKCASLRVIEGGEFAAEFRITHAPYVYVIDEQGYVIDGTGVFSLKELTAYMSRYRLESKENLYASA